MQQLTDHIKEFIRHMLSAIANASLYGMDHPQVLRLTTLAFESLATPFKKQDEFSFLVIDNELIIEGQPIEFSLFLNRFAQMLSKRGISHIRVVNGVTPLEISVLIKALANQTSDAPGIIRSSEHIRLGWVESGQAGAAPLNDSLPGQTGKSDQPDRQRKTLELHDMPEAELERFREIYEAVKKRHKLKINGIIEIVSSFVDAYRQEGRSLLIMAALRKIDEYTFSHSTNVSILNIAQASSLGIEGQLLNDIGVAGMLHDIGKLFIPEEILTKDKALTPAEFEIMQSHPLKGARYLLETPGVPKLAVINAFEHHLKHDLSGYPQVPDGWQQHICSQITTISDIFDALRTRRSYREPLELQHIVDIMRGMVGTELHPTLAGNFFSLIARVTPPENQISS